LKEEFLGLKLERTSSLLLMKIVWKNKKILVSIFCKIIMLKRLFLNKIISLFFVAKTFDDPLLSYFLKNYIKLSLKST